jgi:hypothetical protein
MVISPDGEQVPFALGGVTYTFTSGLSVQDNLGEFVSFLRGRA